MHFNLKSYQVFKLKNYFKNKSLFIVFHCAKLNLKEWVQIEQKLKKLKLNYYKPLNKVTLKELKNSIYFNYSPIINGSVLFVSFDSSNSSSDLPHNLNQLQNSLKSVFIQVSLKLNNKLYSTQQLVKFQNLSYKENIFKFHKVLNKSLKTCYVLTK
jgi:hypothetical protein